MIEISRRDRTKVPAAVADFLSLYYSGFPALFVLPFSFFSPDSESMISNDSGLLESFLNAGILDFIGEVISTESDIGLLVSIYSLFTRGGVLLYP